MDRWSQLSMSEKSDLISLYIKNGISSLEEIKKHYNDFATGDQMNTEEPEEENKGHVTFGTYDEHGNIIPMYHLNQVNIEATQSYRTPEQEAQVTRERNMYFDAMRHLNYGNQDSESLQETYAKYPELKSYLKRIGMSDNDFMSAATGRNYETNSYERERTRQFNKDIQRAEAAKSNKLMQSVSHQNPNDKKLAAIMTGILGGVTGIGILGGLTSVGQGANALNTAKTIGKTALNFMGRPASTLANAQGWTNILPTATAFDKSLMGILGLAGVYDAASRGIKGEIPWHEAVGEGVLSGLMTMDLYPALKGGIGLISDAANAVQKLKPVYLTPKQSYAYRRIQEPIPTLEQAYQEGNFVSWFTNPLQTLVLPQSTGVYPQIKPLIKGAEIEKQLSKTGTISRKSLDAYINKQVKYYQELINDVLESDFKSVDKIDYISLKDAVQRRLPEYNRVKQTDFEDYGLSRLGFKEKTFSDAFDDPRLEHFVQDDMDMFRWRNTGELLEGNNRLDWYKENLPELNTFTFESPNISGNTKHYKGNPIGHSRTYTTKEEPNVLHVMESQSDWGQAVGDRARKYKADKEQIQALRNTPEYREGIITEQYLDIYKKSRPDTPMETHMSNTYTERQIQENLRYAAEQGQTKMRYPTRETAAKIENYPLDSTIPIDDLDYMNTFYGRLTIEDAVKYDELQYNKEWKSMLEILKKRFPEDTKLSSIEIATKYRPEHETILKKYDDFPRQFQKLFGKKAEVRTVTDNKSNTWYEVDIPESYRNKTGQIIFSTGGLLGLGVLSQN